MKTIFILFLIIISANVFGQDTSKDLDSEMKRLKTNTALIAQSQGIDEWPLWSPDADFIACNVLGVWYKFRLTNIELGKADWRRQKIGILVTENAYSIMTAEEVEEFHKVSVFNPREVTTANGTKIELNDGMSVSLIVTYKGKKPKVFWTSGGENCHSLVLSPDEKHVAYLCEMNGLLVMKL